MRNAWPWLAVAVLLLAGHMLPWAQHNTAALTLSGHDLALFLNDTPYAGVLANEWFYVPAWSAGVLLAASSARTGDGRTAAPAWARWAVIGAGVFVAALGLPPFDKLRAFPTIAADYQLRLWVSLAVMAVCIAAVGLRGAASAWLMAAAVLANLVPVYGYSLMRWPLEQLYGNAVSFGAGWWLTLAATAAGAALAAAPVARRAAKGWNTCKR